ncbi:MAG: MoxR family ATPase [Bacteroidota bacterium]
MSEVPAQIQNLSGPEELIAAYDKLGYVADEEVATALYLSLRLNKPLLIEGNPGVGKTELALMLSDWLETDLIRLQCYEGLDVHSAVYEWNYQKQLLAIRIQENEDKSAKAKEDEIFGEDYLMKRPLLKAITAADKAPVLLIDEMDRADEEFEAFLLELLSAFQISIPEMGTIKAVHKPLVILTSNRTRDLSDALKRRCLYLWMHYPSLEKERKIVRKKLPDIESLLQEQVLTFVQQLRHEKLNKIPGIAETLDWAAALMELAYRSLSEEAVNKTIGCLLKTAEDVELVKSIGWQKWLKEEAVVEEI